MILLVALALVILSVPLAGGRLSRMATIRLRWVPLVIAALALQVLVINVVPDALPHAVAAAVHLASYGMAIAFLVVNRHVRGLWIVGLGGLLNLLAIAANGGVMPASPAALRSAGLADAKGFTNSGFVRDARLAFLGDIFAIPRPLPFANVFSVGDVLLVVGSAVVLHATCTRRESTAPRS